MRKIPLENYNLKVVRDGVHTSIPYDVKASLIICLLHPVLKLGARELLIRNKIGMKIEESDSFVLLEEAEYEKLKSAIETIEGFGQNDVELVTRVLEAEEVEVEVK